jgi:hypothetical protein
MSEELLPKLLEEEGASMGEQMEQMSGLITDLHPWEELDRFKPDSTDEQ